MVVTANVAGAAANTGAGDRTAMVSASLYVGDLHPEVGLN